MATATKYETIITGYTLELTPAEAVSLVSVAGAASFDGPLQSVYDALYNAGLRSDRSYERVYMKGERKL